MALEPDLIIVQECEQPSKISGLDWNEQFWMGDNPHKGIGVFSFNDVHISKPVREEARFNLILPFRITSPVEINCLGIWTKNDIIHHERRYIGTAYLALHHYASMLDVVPAIVAGDLNWNKNFDRKPKWSLAGNMQDVVEFLQGTNVYSLYHEIRGMEFGTECEQTYYHQYNEEKGYHTDYIFASKELIDDTISFEIGNFADWRTTSDHVPLSWEFSNL